jgi:hypothetical protein
MTSARKAQLESDIATNGHSGVVEGRQVGDVFQVTVRIWNRSGKRVPVRTHTVNVVDYPTLAAAADGGFGKAHDAFTAEVLGETVGLTGAPVARSAPLSL